MEQLLSDVVPATSGPIGPVPAGQDPEEYDRRRRRILWKMPTGLYLLGSRAGDRRNLMTQSLACQLATDPKLVGVSIWTRALTHELVTEGGVFSLSLLRREDRSTVRTFTKPVELGDGGRSLGGLEIIEAATGAPIPVVAPAWLDCAVRNQVHLGDHTLFIGEVVDCGGTDQFEVLRIEDTRMSYGG